jgi:AraC-like DNA-binding protein
MEALNGTALSGLGVVAAAHAGLPPSLVAARNSVLLVPALQLYSWRAQGRPTGATVSLLVGASHLDGLEATDRAALVTDVALVEQVESLVTQLSRPVLSLDCVSTMRAALGRLTASAALVSSTLPRQGTPLVAARDYLRDHLSEPVTITALADMIGLAESHFIRAFHREFGLPPHAYHLRLRLAAACELLASGLSVSTVAYECGFADQSHLSRKFKAVYGLTPAAWTAAVANGGRPNARPTAVQSIAPGSRRDLRIARALHS